MAALFLAATSQLEPSAAALSYLDSAGLRSAQGAAQQQRAEEAISARPRHVEWRARGIGLSSDEALALVVDALEAGGRV
jgi:hypothetical protein